MVLSMALVGAFLPQTQWAIFEKICSLASGKGREKTSVFPPAPQGRLCRNLSAPTLARAWGIAIPIKVVDAAKARFELLAATAKLALCFYQYFIHNRTRKSSE
jgi:hypothetical protein